ncbi:hypothetical protein [uncultured Thermomonospora sp.]|jgi:hypothetical protein|uniref:hypothetical protein n=1 Tax=uncultured Thermomonospora sp. TaxID=671175 RepID=UPI00259B4D30|nr:hypothetical protein [uncultured Thermomonospora sp.]
MSITSPEVLLRAAADSLRHHRAGLGRLAGPLAAWLEQAAVLAEAHTVDPDHPRAPDHRWCTACEVEECDALLSLDRAVDVARVVLDAGGEER